jgi:hypothetical protein
MVGQHRNPSVGRGPVSLPDPPQKIGDLLHGVSSAAIRPIYTSLRGRPKIVPQLKLVLAFRNEEAPLVSGLDPQKKRPQGGGGTEAVFGATCAGRVGPGTVLLWVRSPPIPIKLCFKKLAAHFAGLQSLTRGTRLPA